MTIFDQIEDASERRAFREVWDAAPRDQIALASRFVDRVSALDCAARGLRAGRARARRARRSRAGPGVGKPVAAVDARKSVSARDGRRHRRETARFRPRGRRARVMPSAISSMPSRRRICHGSSGRSARRTARNRALRAGPRRGACASSTRRRNSRSWRRSR